MSEPLYTREEGAGDAGEKKAYRAADIAKAWSPFYILTAAITIWSLPAFKALFQEGGLLYQSTLLFKMPFLHQQIMKMPPIAPSAMPLDAVFKVDSFKEAKASRQEKFLLNSPVTMTAAKIAVPVADSRSTLKTASNGMADGAIGGIFIIC